MPRPQCVNISNLFLFGSWCCLCRLKRVHIKCNFMILSVVGFMSTHFWQGQAVIHNSRHCTDVTFLWQTNDANKMPCEQRDLVSLCCEFLLVLAYCIVLLQWISGLFQHLSLVQYFYSRKYICPTQLIPFYSTNSYTLYSFKQNHHLAVQEIVEVVIYNDAIGITQEWRLIHVTTYIHNKTFQ
jgi:hypothetical protein